MIVPASSPSIHLSSGARSSTGLLPSRSPHLDGRASASGPPPFAAEELYQVLVRSAFGDSAPESVHLADYPEPAEFPTDEELARGMALAREASALGRAARAGAKIKVRMPLSEATIVAPDAKDAGILHGFVDLVADELNVKKVEVAHTDPPQVKFRIKPNYRTLGPKLGKAVKELADALDALDGVAARAELREKGKLLVEVGGGRHEVHPDDLDVRASTEKGYSAASGARLLVILNTEVTEELRCEGLARDMVSGYQAAGKNVDLPYEARLPGGTWTSAPSLVPSVRETVQAHGEYIQEQTLMGPIVYKAPAEFGDKNDGAVSRINIEGEDLFVRIELPDHGDSASPR